MTEILHLKDVDFVRDSRKILQDINLVVNAGEHWALIGANGAGKSTILSMCSAQQHPTRGAVHVLGQQLGRVEIRKLRESIGHVNPQPPAALSVDCAGSGAFGSHGDNGAHVALGTKTGTN